MECGSRRGQARDLQRYYDLLGEEGEGKLTFLFV